MREGGMGFKTDGTLWAWGYNADYGSLGLNNVINYSSPVQLPGTTWSEINAATHSVLGLKTDGTAWAWGSNSYGRLGLNQAHNGKISSPTQIPGTAWRRMPKFYAGSLSMGLMLET